MRKISFLPTEIWPGCINTTQQHRYKIFWDQNTFLINAHRLFSSSVKQSERESSAKAYNTCIFTLMFPMPRRFHNITSRHGLQPPAVALPNVNIDSKRPPWSRGNVPTSWPEWRGFKPGEFLRTEKFRERSPPGGTLSRLTRVVDLLQVKEPHVPKGNRWAKLVRIFTVQRSWPCHRQRG
jgi:hypothetical protein